LDVVSFNGSEWRAVKDDPGPLPGDGWMLGAKCGRKGDKGERGAIGPIGIPGPQGASVTGVKVSDTDWSLVLTLSNGAHLTCDLFPLFDRFHREAA
jgi:integrin beta 3